MIVCLYFLFLCIIYLFLAMFFYKDFFQLLLHFYMLLNTIITVTCIYFIDFLHFYKILNIVIIMFLINLILILMFFYRKIKLN